MNQLRYGTTCIVKIQNGISCHLGANYRMRVLFHISIRSGSKYTTGIIIIDSDCTDEISRKASVYQDEIAEKINSFLVGSLDKYKSIGFYGSDFSRNTLQWQLSVIVFKVIINFDNIMNRDPTPEYEAPVTAWGEHALLWCVEKIPADGGGFNYCGMTSKHGDDIKFLD